MELRWAAMAAGSVEAGHRWGVGDPEGDADMAAGAVLAPRRATRWWLASPPMTPRRLLLLWTKRSRISQVALVVAGGGSIHPGVRGGGGGEAAGFVRSVTGHRVGDGEAFFVAPS
nr:unnamed protein product [Digitaria exilis]